MKLLYDVSSWLALPLFVSPTKGGVATKGSKCRPSVCRCPASVTNVKVHNFAIVNPIVTKLGSHMHLGNLHAMHLL